MKTSCVSGWSAPQVAIFNTCAGVHHRFIHRVGILSGSEPTGQPLAGQGFVEGQAPILVPVLDPKTSSV